jgi:hypothetical protein
MIASHFMAQKGEVVLSQRNNSLFTKVKWSCSFQFQTEREWNEAFSDACPGRVDGADPR